MNLTELNKIAAAMVAPGRGILAADESSGTIKKRFDAIGVESTAATRRDYREMLFRSTEMAKYISGVILYDETIRQNAADGTPLVKLIEKAGAIPGIKVDKGTKPLPFCANEVVTEGLDGLRERLKEYHGLGARFAKWRAPSPRYSLSRSRRPSRPSATTSLAQKGSGFVPLSTLMPGMAPAFSISLTRGVPSLAFCRIVSSKRMTPEMYLATSALRNSISR